MTKTDQKVEGVGGKLQLIVHSHGGAVGGGGGLSLINPVILWMDEILHHFAKPERMIPL